MIWAGYRAFLLLIPMLVWTALAQGGRRVENERGTVRLIAEDQYVIIPDKDPGNRYAAPLPSDFRVDGLRVLFSGVIMEVPANARLTATPLVLSKIEALKESP